MPSGAEEARLDIAAGHLELRGYGLAAPQDAVFARLLQERFDVELVQVAGCAVGSDQLRQVEAYNREMTAEIDRRFGAGSVERLRADAATSVNAATGPTQQTSKEEWPRYDDPRFSEEERRAVRAATEAVLDSGQPRPDFDQAFRYRVGRHEGDWVVIIWHVHGFKDGKPQFVPGGHTGVNLDQNFKVKSIMPGA